MEAATARLAPSRPSALRAPWSRLRSDEALVDQFRAGDESAFEALYHRHEARMFAICLGVLGSPHDAHDAMQEVWVGVAAALRARPPEKLRPWLARAARNAAIDVVRRRRDEPREEVEAGAHDGSAGLRAELAAVVDGLKELPERQRSALVLRELGGYNYAEIAEALEVKEDAVNGLIARARVSLRSHAESSDLSCDSVRLHLAGEQDGRRRPAEMRRHLRTCSGCRDFQKGMRKDTKALRALAPTAGIGLIPILVAVRGGRMALFGGTIAKGVFGAELSKIAAVCLAGVCATAGVETVSHLAPDRPSQSNSDAATRILSADDAEASIPHTTAARAIDDPARRPFLRELAPAAGRRDTHRGGEGTAGERGQAHGRHPARHEEGNAFGRRPPHSERVGKGPPPRQFQHAGGGHGGPQAHPEHQGAGPQQPRQFQPRQGPQRQQQFQQPRPPQDGGSGQQPQQQAPRQPQWPVQQPDSQQPPPSGTSAPAPVSGSESSGGGSGAPLP